MLYGTQKFGNGPANAGAVFQLTPPAKHGAWTATTIYRFAGGSDGLYPYAGVIADAAGNLYGTTAGDGQTYFGTVYKLTPPQQGGNWTKTTLYAFTGSQDGSGPYAGLIFGQGGVLYSTTAGGGLYGNGTVFEIVPLRTDKRSSGLSVRPVFRGRFLFTSCGMVLKVPRC